MAQSHLPCSCAAVLLCCCQKLCKWMLETGNYNLCMSFITGIKGAPLAIACMTASGLRTSASQTCRAHGFASPQYEVLP